MKVHLIEYAPEWQAWRENLARVERELATMSDVSLICLPEMGFTGYVTHPDEIAAVAQPMDGEIVETMRAWARKYDKAICGSVVIEDGGRYFNRLIFAKPSGELAWADKHHLFLGAEADNFAPGTIRTVVEYGGVRFLLLVCYDLRFPVWSRRVPCVSGGTDMDYDAIIYVASWASSRRTAWQKLLPARAIENQAYVLGVNRIGTDPYDDYAGDSAVIDFKGNDLGVTTDLDMDALHAFRAKFTAWRDADRFAIL